MTMFAHIGPAIGENECHVPAASRHVSFPHLRKAFERQVTWAAEFAKAGDLESGREAQLAADAICDELSDD
ncbi:MAG: hypothetical protein QOH46_783 [Solirubrobacteraceae bacterium]|jgi:hypothetical protein|nr:hypothetical protein [Solirubrobacteraceae bacterium]